MSALHVRYENVGHIRVLFVEAEYNLLAKTFNLIGKIWRDKFIASHASDMPLFFYGRLGEKM